METRTVELFKVENLEPVEIRAEEGKPTRLTGYAAVFNAEADLGSFVERIKPGAFAKALASGRDIRALIDHDPMKILARTSASTLRLGENDRGLWVSIDLPDTSYARDLIASVKHGNHRGMSFGFQVAKGGDTWTKEGTRMVRTLNEIGLHEVTATSIPAYSATTLAVRIDPAAVARAQADEKSFEMKMANCRHRVSNVF